MFRTVRSGATGRRTWTPDEVRQLIDEREFAAAREAAEHLAEATADVESERHCLLGEIAFRERDDEAAAAAYREALKLAPGMPSAHYGLSLVLAAKGQFDDAVRHAQFAVSAQPKQGRYLAQFGYCHLCLGSYQTAENPLRRATLLMADNAYLWNNLGIVLRVKGELEEARDCFARAASLDSSFSAAEQHLAALESEIGAGNVSKSSSTDNSHSIQANVDLADAPWSERILAMERSGRLQEAIDAYESLLLDADCDTRVPVLLARLYERVGDAESAVGVLEAQLNAHPDSPLAMGALGLVSLRMQDFRQAERLLRTATEADPDHLDYVVGLARALSGQERFAEAGPLFERAVQLSPDDMSLIGQRTSNLANQCRYVEAMTIIDELTERGLYVGCKGSVLAFLGRFDEALAALNLDVSRQPNDPALRFQRAHLNLLLENYADGWDDYNYRGLSASKNFRMLPFPVWRGESLEGKKVIVLAEQGLGDQIMFASCIHDLLALKPAQVVVEMSHRVAKTIRRSFPECEVVATNQSVDFDWVKDWPDIDTFVPLADLPAHFRRQTSSFPSHSGYLRADPQRVAYWRARLESSGPGPYIGVSWRGGTELTRTSVRSLAPQDLIPLASAAKATWVCLQYGAVQAEVQSMAETPMPMQYWPESISDLDEFSAMITALDLVITVCNTTVHYAGALGKPVWVLAPKVPEWRYGLTSQTLPWYPSSRMFRQRIDRDWSTTIVDVCQELSLLGPAASRSPSQPPPANRPSQSH